MTSRSGIRSILAGLVALALMPASAAAAPAVSGEFPPGPPTIGEPRTRIDKGPKSPVKTRRKRATVRFRFSSPDAGSGFECRLFKIAAFARASLEPPLPSFRPCRSPKTLRLEPGLYRFEVRAVLGGLPDRSAARRSFKVVRAAAMPRR